MVWKALEEIVRDIAKISSNLL